jgi:hypothetical protein
MVGTVEAGLEVVLEDAEAGVVNAGPEPVVAGMVLIDDEPPSDDVAGGGYDGVVVEVEVATGGVADEVGIVYRVESVAPKED